MAQEFRGLLLDPEEVLVATDPNHWLYDPRVLLPLKESTILDYMKNGVVQPITVTREGDGFIVVAGRRRVLHARAANVRLAAAGKMSIRLKAVLGRGERKDLYGISISENEHREGDGPIARAKKVQRMYDFGSTTEEIAGAFGITAQVVRDWVRLLELCPEVQEMVETGQLRVIAGVTIAQIGMPPEDQIEEAKSIMAAGAQTRASHRLRTGNPSPVPKKKIVTRLLSYYEETQSPEVSQDFIRGIKWREGMISDEEAGLAGVFGEIAKLPAKRR